MKIQIFLLKFFKYKLFFFSTPVVNMSKYKF
jgi:hypothetical protein